MADVALRNIVKRFGKNEEVVAVDDVTIDLDDGEFLALVGPSGCGKSTLLRIIGGLEEPTSGEVYVDGRLVNDVPPRDRKMAMVFQNYALYPQMTVFDNMGFSMKLGRASKEDIQVRVGEVAELLELEDLLGRRPKELSGGQRQRVALGRAIVRQPEVFLMDEPLSNLDAMLRIQTRAELSKLHRRLETTTIYVTHDQVEAMTLGQRVAVLRQGRLQQLDKPRNVYNNPTNTFVAGFIGSPGMNLVRGRVAVDDAGKPVAEMAGTHFVLPPEFDRLRRYGGCDVTFGIRPEDVHPVAGSSLTLREATIPALVSVVESVGSETYVYLDVGTESDLVGRMGAAAEVTPGDRLDVRLDLHRLHAFSSHGDSITFDIPRQGDPQASRTPSASSPEERIAD